MSLQDTVETQGSDWSQGAADGAAEAMILAHAATKDLSAFAATQVDPTTPPRSNPKSPSEASEALNDPSTKSQEEALNGPSTKSQEAQSSSASATPAGPQLTEEAMLSARKAYATHFGLLLENVTPEMVNADSNGAVHWATKDLNLSARGPTAQAMGRAIKHHPDIKEMYQTLLDSEKVRFRQAWAASRDWQFIHSERSTVSSYRKRKEELGTFKTQLQLEMILGGSDKEEARMQAKSYISMCLRSDLKEYCYSWNSWLKADTYLWVESLVATSSQTEWINRVTIQATDNVASSWSETLDYCKAVRAFSCEKDVAIKDITKDMLEQHELGLKGLAKLYETLPNAKPQPGRGDGTCNAKLPHPAAAPAPSAAKAKAKGKAKSAAGEGGDDPMGSAPNGGLPPDDVDEEKNPAKKAKKSAQASGTAKKERELKEYLAMEAQSDNSMTAVTADMSKDPAAWSWAKDFVHTYKLLRTEIVQLYADNEFFKEAKVAALSTKETSRLRKTYGIDYHSKLCEWCCQLGPKIQGMYECTTKIRQMADAHANAMIPPSVKAPRKPKRSASQASL
ncbi:unnamed protein product [Symbiodinium sp. CCMP2592]|nr:unnamed protein product [Symbiodinium sp. CCMP2592]